MSSGDASGIVQCNPGIFDSFRLLSMKNWRGFPKRCAASKAFGSTSLLGSYCCRRVSCLFLDDFNSSELI